LGKTANREPDDAAIETIEIPVCYDAVLHNNLVDITKVTGLSAAEIIQLHSSRNYYVYMLGFLPGFAYMGEVDERIALPRKPNPVNVTAGSVAIAGKQTGIYPLDSFGGWNVLGHTPVKIFNQFDTEPCFLKAGQEVKFRPIPLKEYRQLLNAKP
jgi:inhibitor of KinA